MGCAFGFLFIAGMNKAQRTLPVNVVAELGKLADMPTRDQAISMLMSAMQAPITKLARTLNEVPGKLVRTVDAVRSAKEAA